MKTLRPEELAFIQVVIVCVILLVSSVFTVLFYKVKFNLKSIVWIIITGLVLCSLSLLVIWNGSSGEYLTNRFGWPRVFYFQNWTFDSNNNYFDIIRFLTNLGTWILISFNLFLIRYIVINKKKSINKIVVIAGIIFAILIPIIWSLFTSYSNTQVFPYFSPFLY